MKIKYIDSKRFMRGLYAGAKRVFDKQNYLNEINVFPVPDADTGTNMAATLRSILDNIRDNSGSIEETSRQVADSALEGARGNSGVILAQFFHGLSRGLEQRIRITTEQFGNAVRSAKEHAYQSLSQPREGTILTVIKDWADNIVENSRLHFDFHELFHRGLEAAKSSLESTRDKLEALRKANVVDSGAQGFVYILEGIAQFMTSGRIKELPRSSALQPIEATVGTVHDLQEIRYRFCTECLIRGQRIDVQRLRSRITPHGDSIVLAGSDHLARLHIHSDAPAKVFSIAREYGDLLQQKADDMQKQYQTAHTEHATIALVVDSACDLPPEFFDAHNIHIVPVRVSFGNSTYLDKITITPEYFYEMLANESEHPKTSQPPPSDFRNLYQYLLTHYESIISIHLPEPASGTYQNALRAAREFPDVKISVIDGRGLSVSLGFIVEETAHLIERGLAHDEIVSELEDSKKRTQIFVSIPSLKYLMRSGRVSRAKGLVAKLANIKPILQLDERGMPQHYSKSFSDWGAVKKVLRIVLNFAKNRMNPRFMVAHANDVRKADFLVAGIRSVYGDIRIPVLPVSPVLGAHAGNGAAAVGIAWEA